MIVTFYSFKGGVGRSHMLVETAVRLAKSGRSVLVWDLDLEAPGMQRLPDLASVDERLQSGTLDLLTEFQEDYELPRELLRESTLDLSSASITDRGGRLSFLLPAKLDETYASKFAGVRWHELFAPETGAGPAFFHAVAKVLQEELGFELVLIDSRTGFTDLSAICTLQLPDLVVVVFNLNEQNLAGVERVHKAITSTDARHVRGENSKIPALLLANMVPPASALKAPSQILRGRKLDALAAKGLKPHFTVDLDITLLLTDAIGALREEPRQAKELVRLAEEIDRRYVAIAAQTQPITLESASGSSFEKEVAQLFSILGYEVMNEYKSGAEQFDMRITRRTGLPDVALVECRPAADPRAIEALGDRVERARAKDRAPYRALFVSRRAVEHRPLGLVQVLDYDELAYSTINAAMLAENTAAEFRGSALERLYIDLSVVLESEPSVATKLSGEISSWLERDRQPLFILLGDAGAGKTSFAKKLAADSSEEWRERRAAGMRLPVLINLAEARGTSDLGEIIAQQITRITAIPVAPEAVRLLNRAGKLLLILDGLDEAGDLSTSLLRTIFLEADGAAKILVTSRPDLFRAPAGERGARPGSLRPAGATSVYVEAIDLGAELAELQPLTQEEIESYLRKAKPPPESWEEIAQRIAKDEELRAIAERPFLLAMIAELEQLDAQSRDLTPLYEEYCRPWLEGRPGSRFPESPRSGMIARLAQTAWTQGVGSVHFTTIASWTPGFRREEVDEELRWAPFLRRDAEGNYRFAHNSFRSFFLARALRRAFDLGGERGLKQALDAPRFGADVFRFLAIRSEDVELLLCARRLLSHGERQVGANALMLIHVAGKPFPSVSGQHVSLTDANLSDAELEGIDLSGTALVRCNFDRAKLSGARFDDSTQAESSFAFAELRNAVFQNSRLTKVRFDHADLSGASFDTAIIEESRFDRAQLAAASFEYISFDDPIFRGARRLDAASNALSTVVTPGAPIVPLGHTDGVRALAWSSDGAYLASAGADRRVLIWDGATGELLHSLHLEHGQVGALAWDPKDETLAVMSKELVEVFDVVTGERSRLDVAGEPTALSWSASGRAIGYADGSVHIAIGSKSWQHDHLDVLGISALDWSADGCLAAASERTLALLQPGPFAPPATKVGPLPVSPRHVSWLNAGEILVLDTNGTARTVARSGALLRSFGSFGNVSSAAISPDKTRLAIRAHGQLDIIAVDSGQQVARSERPDFHTPAIAWGRQDRIAVADEASIAVVDPKLAEQVLLRGSNPLRNIAWSPRGTFLAAHGFDRTLRLWAAKDAPSVGGDGVEAMASAWCPDGALLAVATREARILLLGPSSLRVAKELGPIQKSAWQTEMVWSMAWSADSENLAVGCAGGLIKLFGRVERTLQENKHSILMLGWSEELLIALTSGSLSTWDAAAGSSVARIEATNHYSTIAVHPKEALVVAGSDDGQLALWDPRTSKIDRTAEAHTDRVQSVTFSPDGQLIASAASDGTIALLDRSLKRQHTLTGHQGPVMSLSWRKDGLLASAALDGTIKLWRTSGAPRCIATLYLLEHQRWVVCSEEGYVAGSKDALSRVRFPDRWAQYTLDDLPKRLDPVRALEGIIRKKKRRARPAKA